MKEKQGSGALLASLAVLAAALVLLLVLTGKKPVSPTAPAAEVRAGMEFLRTQEMQDPAAVDDAIQQHQEAHLAEERQDLVSRINNGEIAVWSYYEDYVVLGDARAIGFYLYDYLESIRVFAGGGDTIRNAEDHLSEIKAFSPTRIYLCYGLNDVNIGFWSTPEEYAAEVVSTALRLEEQVPGARVVVSSILPVQEPGLSRGSKWAEIPQYNEALAQACRENGIHFADCSRSAGEHLDLWQPDGIHLGPDFYPYWAAELAVAGLDPGESELPAGQEGRR